MEGRRERDSCLCSCLSLGGGRDGVEGRGAVVETGGPRISCYLGGVVRGEGEWGRVSGEECVLGEDSPGGLRKNAGESGVSTGEGSG